MRKVILIGVLAAVAAILFFPTLSKPSNAKKAEIGIGGGVELPIRMTPLW
jgi:hypothetical protein